MFPGDTDPSFEENWDETTAGNTPSDRRFIQSAGPFTLEPGAVNYITTGVVWAKAEEGGPLASVEKMKEADILAQTLFDNCFDINYFIYGCTCEIAINYNEEANVDNGSCITLMKLTWTVKIIVFMVILMVMDFVPESIIVQMTIIQVNPIQTTII